MLRREVSFYGTQIAFVVGAICSPGKHSLKRDAFNPVGHHTFTMGQLFSSLFPKKPANREPKAEPFLKSNGGGSGGTAPSVSAADKAQLELKRTRDRFSKAELRLNHEMEVRF